jgi:tRNA (guanine-N7-)-methyltransferase
MGAGTLAAPSLVEPADVFGRVAPLALDLGCGNGVFLAALAARFPEWNCLGIEKKDYRVRQAKGRIRGTEHARVLHGEVTEVMRGLSPGCVGQVYLLFSDPWPKRRHAVRRLVQPGFASLLRFVLARDGVFFFASDSGEYARDAARVFREQGWMVENWVVPGDWPATEFEQRFRDRGMPVHRFQAAP